MSVREKRKNLSEIARDVRGDFCRVCKERVEQDDETFASRGICVSCMMKCAKCERDLDSKESRVCKGCRKDHSESERERIYRNADEFDSRKSGFFGGQIHRDVKQNELNEWRREERLQVRTEEMLLGQDKMPATGVDMKFCNVCYLSLPVTGICGEDH